MTESIGKELFNELNAGSLSDCPSDFKQNYSVTESDESDIILPKQQKRNVIKFNSKRDFKDWNENNIKLFLKDYSKFQIDNVQNGSSKDRLCKIRPLLNYLIPKIQFICVPKQQLSLDETMIPWKGHLSFKT
uniref:DDE_Tnp_1_7 domain-containing protein n=1 Tax=Strongyloides stercoralis TaxID=6248 RepID=A0A0K0DS38_STRER